MYSFIYRGFVSIVCLIMDMGLNNNYNSNNEEVSMKPKEGNSIIHNFKYYYSSKLSNSFKAKLLVFVPV